MKQVAQAPGRGRPARCLPPLARSPAFPPERGETCEQRRRTCSLQTLEGRKQRSCHPRHPFCHRARLVEQDHHRRIGKVAGWARHRDGCGSVGFIELTAPLGGIERARKPRYATVQCSPGEDPLQLVPRADNIECGRVGMVTGGCAPPFGKARRARARGQGPERTCLRRARNADRSEDRQQQHDARDQKRREAHTVNRASSTPPPLPRAAGDP